MIVTIIIIIIIIMIIIIIIIIIIAMIIVIMIMIIIIMIIIIMITIVMIIIREVRTIERIIMQRPTLATSMINVIIRIIVTLSHLKIMRNL